MWENRFEKKKNGLCGCFVGVLKRSVKHDCNHP